MSPQSLFMPRVTNVFLSRWALGLLAVLVGLIFAWDRQPSSERIYTLAHASAEQVAEAIRESLAALPSSEYAIETEQGRLYVTGGDEVHSLVDQLVAQLDRPPSAEEQPAAQPPVAPPSVETPDENPEESVRRVLALQSLDWPTLHRLLQSSLRRPVTNTGEDQTCFELAVRPGQFVSLEVNEPASRIAIVGAPHLVDSVARVVTALDQRLAADGRATSVVSVSGPAQAKVRKTLGPLAPGRRPMQFAMLQQPPEPPAEGPPDDQPPADGGDVAGNPLEVGEGQGTDGGLIGPVQIEFLEGLDVIVIRGNKKDVERVIAIIDEIERLSGVTEPEIVVLQLEHAQSEAVATLILELYTQILSPRAGNVSITPLVKPNALLLIGRAESVKTIAELAQKLDQPVDPATQLRVFRLKHIASADAKATVDEFFAERTGLGTRVLATADYRSNALIVQASPRDVAEVAHLLERLDTPTSDAVNELRVFRLENSLAEDLAPILQDAIAVQSLGAGQQAAPAAGGQNQGAQSRSSMLRFLTIDGAGQQRLSSGILTDVKVTADPRANALLVSAPPESMGLIAALVTQLDQMPAAESQIKVFTISNGDAAGLVEMLETLFGEQAAAQGTGGPGGQNAIVRLRFSIDQRTNSIIASGTSPDLAVVEAILLRLDDSDVDQRKTTVYRLKNSPAADVANAVNELLRSEREVQQAAPGAVSPFEQIEREVVVVPEPVSNSLIVSATPRYYEEIRKLVEELDERPPMVMIQVLIAEVTLNNIDEFGVELGLQDSLLFDRGLLGDLLTTTQTTQTTSPGGAVTSVTQDTIQAATLTPGFLFNNLALGDSGSDQSLSTRENTAAQGLSHFAVNRTNSELGFGGFVFSASSESVSVLMRALKENRRLDVLSRPQVMTLDNQPAFIQVGQRVPRITGTTINETGQVNTIQLENVGIILGVTPRISPDGLVVMEIDAEKSDVGPESEGIPISIAADGQVIRSPRINTTTAQTTISASSGQTVVLGGLITKSKSETHRKVPFIGDLPLLGHLFRYDSEVARRTELLIIMTPRVVNNEQDSEIIKQVESSRMNWVLSDVVDLHGPSGLRSRTDEWGDDETNVIYPGMDEVWPEEIAPEPTIIMPNGQLPGPSGAPSRLQPTPADASPAEGARGESLPLPEGGAWKSGGRSVLRQPQLIKRTGHEEPIPNQPIHRASYDRPMRLPPTR